jgi:hypothetical protein
MVETAAFNFPDRNTMYFSCKIRLCYTNDNCNAVTPPKCGRRAAEERFGSTTDATSIELAGHGDGTTITDALDTEQLISSTTPLSAILGEKHDSPQSTTEKARTTTQRATQFSSTTIPVSTIASLKSSTNVFPIPSDFPRPSFLPQDDNGSGESMPPEVDSWMVSDEPTPTVLSKTNNDSTTQAPVQLLKKKGSTKSETATKQSARQQKRNATPMPRTLLDVDVDSPELTIMDDYAENAAGNEPSIQSQKQILHNLGTSAQMVNRGICLSPIMMVCFVCQFSNK